MRPVCRVDVAIVGGGPAGSSCAIVLANAGMRVALIDRAIFPRPKICGDCLNPKVWELLDVLGVRDDLQSKHPHVLDAIHVVTMDGGLAELTVPSGADQPFIAFDRSGFDEILIREARRRGAEVLEGERVHDVKWNNRWILNSRRTTIEADYIVGADGRNSVVARLFGTVVSGRRTNHADRIGMQWRCRRVESLGSSIRLFLFRGGYCGMVNLDDRIANIALVASPHFLGEKTGDTWTSIERMIATNKTAISLLPSLEPVGKITTAFPINPVIRTSRHSRVLLVGDARRTVEPFTGEGVFFALQDGIAAAESLAGILRGTNPMKSRHQEESFWANRVFSPVLRHPVLANAIAGVGARFPLMTDYLGKKVLGDALRSPYP